MSAENQLGKSDRDIDLTVAHALESVAYCVRCGVSLEEIDPCVDENPSDAETDERIFANVVREVVWLLKQHRDFGSELDRILNRKGAVLFPVELLEDGVQMGNLEERYGL